MTGVEEFDVEIFGRVYRVETDSYSKARTLAAHLYNKDSENRNGEIHPITFLVMYSACTKVNRPRMGRPRKFEIPVLDNPKKKKVRTKAGK